ncbi:multidrug ABC transporter ATPase [Enterococcus saigonensis]|uniref:Multidrug resistance ABC transporter ATP-binding and permease protein n=1 Tax=Enterococcus saigonensis TaxID=1805431 RepID=A0A679INN9_9ENTE|nr:ABC transporter ATP-binding protein [Enterococcus saigonensis]BCA86461.1 multidrug ABC transporter ATPase [Enterococcus saigonensis]
MARMRFDFDQTTKKPELTLGFIRRILNYFKPHTLKLILVIFLILATSTLGLVPSLLLQKIVDVALPKHNLTQLSILVGLSISATILLNLLQVAQGYLSTWIAKNITLTMKNNLYRQLSFLPQSFFTTVKEGEILTRLTSDVDGIQQVFQTTFINALSSIFILATTLFALFSMNPILAVVALVTVPLFILPTRKVGKRRWQIASASQQALSKLNQHTQETLSTSGSTLMKLFTKEEEAFATFNKINQEVTALQIKESLAGRWFRMAMSVLMAIGPMLIYLVGGFLLTRGQLTIGGIITFASLLGRLYNPVTQLSNIQVDLLRSFALFERIFEYMDITPAIQNKPNAKKLVIDRGEVVFSDVNFHYEENEVLKTINLKILPGETLALVGPSGAGKSTLTHLLTRLYDPTSGTVTIDNQNIKEITLTSLRQNIGVVSQETFLFNGTIYDNLLYANENASKIELIAATKAAYIHDFIMTLPNGYDTVVGNRGIKLSGGEKQRIAIARMILKNPQILILDEATSALDAISEYYVQKAMDNLMQNRTSIVIAHRLSTIANADQIAVMEHGEIVEQGKHAQLIEKDGLYARLYQTQFKNTEAAA